MPDNSGEAHVRTSTDRRLLSRFIILTAVLAITLGLAGLSVLSWPGTVEAQIYYTVTNTNDSGNGSLRWAIQQVNADPGSGPFIIDFNITTGSAPWTITLAAGSPLPSIQKDDVTIDGYTQSGALEGTLGESATRSIVIEIDGSNQPAFPCLQIDDRSNCVVRGLAINRFLFYVQINGANASNNVVEGNYFGTDTTGTVELGSGLFGAVVSGGAYDNLVGGVGLDTGVDGNLISGSGSYGVYVSSGGTNNLVQGNYVGTDVTGINPMGNNFGVFVQDSPGSLIGGENNGEGNLVSGNDFLGVAVAGNSTSNNVWGNWVGINSRGDGPLANGSYGIVLSLGAQDNTIGGSSQARRNVASGNGAFGVFVGNPGTGENRVMGNYVGTDPSGTSGIGNGSYGIWVGDETTSNFIGGETAGSGNLASGNAGAGVFIAGASGNKVRGNRVGINATGDAAIPNGLGISITGSAQDNFIGGTSDVERNVISGNTGDGVRISESGAMKNVLAGNLIGTDPSGSIDIGNGSNGVSINDSASDNTIGGSADAGNIIRANAANGVQLIDSSDCEISHNTIEENGLNGVLFLRSTSSTVSENRIWSNRGTGVVLSDKDSYEDEITRNSIYTNGSLGIDLGEDGVTPNDGNNNNPNKPNRGYNFPVFSQDQFEVSPGGYVTVTGTAPPGSNVEVYSTGPLQDPSGHGEGMAFNTTATADGAGNFTAYCSGMSEGDHISSIAISDSGNTSEFSANAALIKKDTSKTPGAEHWFLAEGSTGEGFDTWILLENPQDDEAAVDVTFTGHEGPFDTVPVSMPPRSRATLRIADYVPDDWHISTLVESSVPIVAERSMYWDRRMMGQSSVAGDPQPYEMRSGHANLGTPQESAGGFSSTVGGSRVRYFAEGATAGGFDTWVLLCNPGEEDATAQVTLMTYDGVAAVDTVIVPALSRRTVHLDSLLPDAFGIATEVVSDKPLVAERSMYWDPDAAGLQPYEMRGGHSNDGSPATGLEWSLAEGSTGMGFDTYILIQNPDEEEARVNATFMDIDGVAAREELIMAPRSRATLRVSDYVPDNWHVATTISSDRPVVAERSMYWDRRAESEPYAMRDGHSTVGVMSTGTAWMLPEGSTGGGFDSWVLVTNPNDSEANVSVDFLSTEGHRNRVIATLQPYSRYNFHVNDYVYDEFHVSTFIESDTGLVVERAMYWDNRTAPGIQPYEMMGGHSATGVDP